MIAPNPVAVAFMQETALGIARIYEEVGAAGGDPDAAVAFFLSSQFAKALALGEAAHQALGPEPGEGLTETVARVINERADLQRAIALYESTCAQGQERIEELLRERVAASEREVALHTRLAELETSNRRLADDLRSRDEEHR